jgi:hypothetical protein
MDTSVAVALITTAPVAIGLTYTIASARSTRKIVKGNGMGDLCEMMENMLDRQERHERKTDNLLDWQIDHERAHAVAK